MMSSIYRKALGLILAVALLSLSAIVNATPLEQRNDSPKKTTTTSSSAAPTSTSTKSLTINYNFETVMNGNPIAATTEIKEYNLLFFSMNLVTPGVAGTVPAGLLVHSIPNAATFSARTQTTNGLPIISVNYQESQISSFDPFTFYYGCVAATGEAVATTPVSCVITVDAYDVFNKTIASQAFTFNYNGGLTQNQNLGIFNPNFKNVYTLQFSVTNAATTAALIDDFVTTLHMM